MREWLRRSGEVLAACLVIAALGWAAHATWLPVRVGGMSMRPALTAGDLALVRLGGSPRPGHIALVESRGRAPMLHRIASIAADGAVHTRGDANPIEDLEPAPLSAVKGSVVAVVPVGNLLQRWRDHARVR